MFKLKEFRKNIQPIFNNDNVETLQFNTVCSGNLSNYGGYIYQLDVQQDGLYRIQVSPGVRSFVYVYGAEVLPDQQGYYAFSNGSSPLIYLAGSANQEFTIKVEKEDFTVSNVNYNNNAGAKLGKNNSVTLQLSKTSAGTGTYQVSLYCAGSAEGEGGLRSQPQEVTLNGSAPVSLTFDNVALYGGGTGNIYTYVKVSLEQNGVGADSNRIQNTINGVLPQEIKFEKITTDSDGVDHYYLFDDHPEHIRKCDLLDSDDPNYPKRLLSHHIALPPGKYLAFSYHHVNSDLFGTPIYFDGVFYNTGGRSGNVTITKLTLSSGSWDIRRDPWQNYIEGNNVLSRENFSVTGTNPFWLSSITGLKQISNELTDGVVHMMMEFEVTGGSVNFATAAYKNAVTAKNYFLNHQEETESVYENLNTILKGKGATAQIISAQEINYIIDGSDFVRGYLPVIINNDAYANKEQKVFTTQAHILNDNIRAAEPGSSIVPLEYEGIGVTRDQSSLLETGYLEEKTWTFDGTHTASVANIEIPENLQQYFGGKEWFTSNEDIKPWLNRSVSIPGWG